RRPGYWLAGVALLAVIVMTAVKRFAPPAQSPSPPVVFQPPPSVATLDQNDGADAFDVWHEDVWLTFVADLAAGVDPDAARDAGLDAMNAEHALLQLNDGELRELERLF